MVTDDFIHRQLRDILSRNPDATHPEIMDALAYRARLNWGRVPASIHLAQRGLDSAIDIARKYSPDQPRVPAGNSDGGRWTSEGGREARLEARNQALLREVRRSDSKYDVLKNPDGSFVYGPTGELVKFPKEFPPNFFIEEGEKNNIWRLVRTKPTSDLAGFNIINEAAKFRTSGKWDMQRRFNETSGPMDHSLRDYSTIAIGLYAYGASIHPLLMTYIEATYAYFNNNTYDPSEPTLALTRFPVRNVENTYIGYELGGRIRGQR